VVAGYAVGIILYAFAFIPGALGVYEAGMTGMLAAVGIGARTALAGTILFRGFSFWLPIPIGFAIYHWLVRRTRRTPETEAEPSPTSASAGPAHAETQPNASE